MAGAPGDAAAITSSLESAYAQGGERTIKELSSRLQDLPEHAMAFMA